MSLYTTDERTIIIRMVASRVNQRPQCEFMDTRVAPLCYVGTARSDPCAPALPFVLRSSQVHWPRVLFILCLGFAAVGICAYIIMRSFLEAK